MKNIIEINNSPVRISKQPTVKILMNVEGLEGEWSTVRYASCFAEIHLVKYCTLPSVHPCLQISLPLPPLGCYQLWVVFSYRQIGNQFIIATSSSYKQFYKANGIQRRHEFQNICLYDTSGVSLYYQALDDTELGMSEINCIKCWAQTLDINVLMSTQIMRIMPVYTIFTFPQTSWPKLQPSLLVNNELKFLLMLWPTYLIVFNCINGFKLCFYIRMNLFISGTYSMSNHKVPTEYDSCW